MITSMSRESLIFRTPTAVHVPLVLKRNLRNTFAKQYAQASHSNGVLFDVHIVVSP